jgi:hypothetical protein
VISFNSLGSLGRLGNQMFQYASLKGIARNRGFEFSIPWSPFLDPWRDHQLSNVFKLQDNLILNSPEQPYTAEEKFFGFDYDLFNYVEDNSDLVGYFQTERYFSHIKDEILEDFSFKEKFDDVVSDYFTVIHVRRTDYLAFSNHHPTCSLDYYKEAMDITGGPFLVVSDDIEWCQKNITADEYSKSSNVKDLYLMSKAKNNIIANSSFSWWGAWLNQNPNKKVIAPNKWFGPAYDHYNLEDLIPKEWIKL